MNATTALKQYTDPFSFDAVGSTRTILAMLPQRNISEERRIRIPNGSAQHFLMPSEVIMIKSDSNYSTIYAVNGVRIFTSRTLKYWFQKFKSPSLCRVHRSYVINLNKIESIADTKVICLDENLIALCSRRKKAATFNIVQ